MDPACLVSRANLRSQISNRLEYSILRCQQVGARPLDSHQAQLVDRRRWHFFQKPNVMQKSTDTFLGQSKSSGIDSRAATKFGGDHDDALT